MKSSINDVAPCVVVGSRGHRSVRCGRTRRASSNSPPTKEKLCLACRRRHVRAVKEIAVDAVEQQDGRGVVSPFAVLLIDVRKNRAECLRRRRDFATARMKNCAIVTFESSGRNSRTGLNASNPLSTTGC